MIDTFLQGKIRVKLLTKLLLNPSNTVYLRGLEKEFGVSSNTVRIELNKLREVKLIEVVENLESNQKQYRANANHPLFDNLRGFILKQFGLDSLIEKVFDRLGDLEEVYLTHDWAQGKTGPFMDLVVVGKVDQSYMYDLIVKVEPIIQRKIRVAVYQSVFELPEWNDIPQIKLI
jgi:predicted AAA+ superfamily ATPase